MNQNVVVKSNQNTMDTMATIDPTQDPSSIYYIHPSDSAGNRLVSIVFYGTIVLVIGKDRC